MVKIKIIRHSERFDYTHPVGWLFCFGYPWSDAPLTYRGYKYAEEKGKKMIEENFHPKYIYSSPYNRTLSTSTEIKKSFPNCQIVIEPLLAEYQPYFRHSVILYPDGIPTTFNDQQTPFTYPETQNNFGERVQFIINKLIENNEDDFIIVTHGEILKFCISYLQNMFPNLNLENTSTPYLTVISFDYDKKNNYIVESSIKIYQNN